MSTSTPYLYKGKIVGFVGTWSSGMAVLVIDDEKRGRVELPCDNGTTVRSLEAAFGDVIAPQSHCVDPNGGHVGQEIYYYYDEMDLMMAGFVPASEATEELENAYDTQK